jgi:hypothetical protein
MSDTMPPWMFPAPVRRSRFVATGPQWSAFNIEVALDRIRPFALGKQTVQPALSFDYQTQIENNTVGRHGAGRAGVFRGYYVKGVGRTQAAANWNDLQDRYHGSGHLSVASALRERLISAALIGRGLGDAIVPCESVLVRCLRRDERRAVALGQSSSQPSLTPADACLSALSVKRADFARASNFIWALNHFSMHPAQMGNLFLEFERYLNPPNRRDDLGGEPAAIVRAMNSAFRRGLANFARYDRIGLFWMYTNNNFTLDGRFVDLETPMFFGAPFAGIFQQEYKTPLPYRFLGFEGFAFVLYWRLFLNWFQGKLRYLTSPGVLEMAALRSFLREIARQIRQVFPPKHLLYDDAVLQSRAASNLSSTLDLERQGRAHIRELARRAFERTVYAVDDPPPDFGWRPISFQPAPISATPFRITAPSFLKPGLSVDAGMFAAGLERVGAQTDPQALLRSLDSTSDALTSGRS